jgi:hypothetical protein
MTSAPKSASKVADSPHSIAAIVAELAGQGINASGVLEGAGLTSSQIDAHTTRISYRHLDIVIRNALRLSNDPAIALRAGLRMHVTAYGMYGCRTSRIGRPIEPVAVPPTSPCPKLTGPAG